MAPTHFKQTLPSLAQAVLCLNIILTLITTRSSHVMGLYITPINKISYSTDMTDEQQVRDLSVIIESLENLGVLDKSHTVCYSLDKIVKVVDSPGSPTSWRINIDMHIQELGSARQLIPIGGSGSNNNEDSTARTTGAATTGCFGRVAQSTTTAVTTDQDILQSESNDTNSTTNSTDSSEMTTVSFLNTTTLTGLQVTVDENESGLSLAQIMVVSSCSIVVGLFFVAALTMRIRNYIKRKRQLKLNRKKFRGSSFGDRDSSQGFGTDTISQDAHPPNRSAFSFVRPKALRTPGYKMGSNSGGFSLFYPNDIGGGWTQGFSY